MVHPPLTLASASPRRRELLSLLGLPFRIIEANVEERRLEAESPQQMVMRLSLAKAQAVIACAVNSIIIACDTIVVLEGDVLGKPANPEEATRMLRRLRGRAHRVYSGLTVLAMDWNGPAESDPVPTVCDETVVHMRAYTDEEITGYVATGDPFDKAGAYAIQHAGFHPVAYLEGCYSNVMGLPLHRVASMLRSLGQPVPDDRAVAIACASFTGHPCCLAGGGELPGPRGTGA
jgi:septum formation protein